MVLGSAELKSQTSQTRTGCQTYVILRYEFFSPVKFWGADLKKFTLSWLYFESDRVTRSFPSLCPSKAPYLCNLATRTYAPLTEKSLWSHGYRQTWPLICIWLAHKLPISIVLIARDFVRGWQLPLLEAQCSSCVKKVTYFWLFAACSRTCPGSESQAIFIFHF